MNLADLASTRERIWANMPACAHHYPQPCECETTMSPKCMLRSVILDMGPYLWYYETAEITDDNEGNLRVKAVNGCVPRIIPKTSSQPEPTHDNP